MQENRFRHKLKTAEGVNQTLYPIIDPIEGTYAELKALKNANRLIIGQWYKMTDYKAIWKDPITGNTIQGEFIEVLLLFAVTGSSFNSRVYSIYNPTDIILYNMDQEYNGLVCGFWVTSSRGFIYRRIDRFGTDCSYDFRGIYFKRYSLNTTSFTDHVISNSYNKGSFVKYNSKFYIAKKNVPENTDLSNKEYWFKIIYSELNGIYFIVNESTFIMKSSSIINLPILQSYNFYLNIRGCKIERYITTDVNNNTVLKLNNIIFINSTGTLTIGAIFIGKNSFNLTFINNVDKLTIGENCQNNVFERDFFSNRIGDNCKFNYFGEGCKDNVIGNNFQYNTVGRMIGNQIGNDFQENLISDDFNYNIVGHKFQKKTIKNGFEYKKIDSNLTEEKDLDSHEKLFDNNLNIELTKGYDNIDSELKYAIRFFDPITEADTVNVLE